MPPQHGLGLHDDQGGAPVPPGVGEAYPEESIRTLAKWEREYRTPTGEFLERINAVLGELDLIRVARPASS
jgi:hypothetical protein